MAVEIERKFLVISEDWKKNDPPRKRLCQGYFPVIRETGITLRVRIVDDQAFLTVKGPTAGASRKEYEYPIPREDAEEMLLGPASGMKLEKLRYFVPAGNGLVWEIDEFLGCNKGLVVAEIELPAEDTSFERPAWLGKEVTGIGRYYNSSLTCHPWNEWSDEEKVGNRVSKNNR